MISVAPFQIIYKIGRFPHLLEFFTIRDGQLNLTSTINRSIFRTINSSGENDD